MQRRYMRSGRGHFTIQGRRLDINIARMVYHCIHCLADLERHNHGLRCTLNDCHYGFIHQNEAKEITQEERFMRIGEMFPSEYLRGIDVGSPFKVTIAKVAQEMTRNRDNNKMEPEFVMYFEGSDKKLRLNITMAKECAKIFNDPDMDTDNWLGKQVTVYRETIKAFGKDHIVPRIRQTQRGDKALVPDIKFKKIDELLYQLNQDFGVSESDAKKILKQQGHTIFTQSKSGVMYDGVRDFVTNGFELEANLNGDSALEGAAVDHAAEGE